MSWVLCNGNRSINNQRVFDISQIPFFCFSLFDKYTFYGILSIVADTYVLALMDWRK